MSPSGDASPFYTRLRELHPGSVPAGDREDEKLKDMTGERRMSDFQIGG